VEANVAEQDIGRVAPGANAEVRLAAYPDSPFMGKVTDLSAVMDKDTRTIPVRIEVAIPEGKLRPEMFASVASPTSGKVRQVSVPAEAVVLMQGVSTVFVEGAQGFAPRTVQVGERTSLGVVIASGLKAGDMVVVEGAYELKARSFKSQLGSGHAH
jgi:RND family efflux transporter MFP subunit